MKKLRLLAAGVMVIVMLTGCAMLTGNKAISEAAPQVTGDTVTVSREEYDRLKQYQELDEVLKVVQEYYYQEPEVPKLIENAERGLLFGLEDPYSFYYSPEEYSKLWEEDEGKYAGIGIQISANFDTLLCTVSRVFKGSPAKDVGIHKGDILKQVNDLIVDAYNLQDAVDIMRGNVGETVNVTVRRGTETLDFTVPRANIQVNRVESVMLEGDVGVISLFEFAGDCRTAFTDAVSKLTSDGAKGLIVDLRDNPGGWVDDAVAIADIFLPEVTVYYTENRKGEREYASAQPGQLDIPLVVIMNENSASASEVLAGALQDHGVATIVGVTSYGKGIIQYVMPVGDKGAGMQLTVAQYFTPNGNKVHKTGITPNVVAELPEGDTGMYETGDMKDPQLSKAVEVLKEKMQGSSI
jgi:carboxyl-terminal processing protease